MKKNKIMDKNIDITLLIPRRLIHDNLARFGSENDGGYIFPEKIYRNAKQLISLGVKDDWNFESEFIKSRLDNSSPTLKVKAYDLVVDEWYFLKCFIGFTLKFKFIKAISNLLLIYKFNFFFKKNSCVEYLKKGISGNKTGYIKLSEILNNEDIKDSLLLSIDIEGDEYSIIDDIISFKEKIDAMVIEFHDLDKKTNLFNGVIDELNKHFSIVHLHLNNNSILLKGGISNVIEISFVNNKFLTEKINEYHIPTNLDRPCNKNLPEFNLILQR